MSNWAIVNQHAPADHPPNAGYYLGVDEPQVT
jgi:hypothetical protein